MRLTGEEPASARTPAGRDPTRQAAIAASGLPSAVAGHVRGYPACYSA